METNTVKLQIIGQFDRYDFFNGNDKIWFKNLIITSNEDEPTQTFIGEAFIKKNDAIHLIGELTYQDKISFDAEILLNEKNEYEIIEPISVLKIKEK
jgi:hypothetical protein